MESSNNGVNVVESETDSVEFVQEEMSSYTMPCEKQCKDDKVVKMKEIVDLTYDGSTQVYNGLVELDAVAEIHTTMVSGSGSSGASTTYTVIREENKDETKKVGGVSDRQVFELIKSNHVVVCNKLETLLRYFEDELQTERTRCRVLEQKLKSIDKLIEGFEKEMS